MLYQMFVTEKEENCNNDIHIYTRTQFYCILVICIDLMMQFLQKNRKREKERVILSNSALINLTHLAI